MQVEGVERGRTLDGVMPPLWRDDIRGRPSTQVHDLHELMLDKMFPSVLWRRVSRCHRARSGSFRSAFVSLLSVAGLPSCGESGPADPEAIIREEVAGRREAALDPLEDMLRKKGLPPLAEDLAQTGQELEARAADPGMGPSAEGEGQPPLTEGLEHMFDLYSEERRIGETN